MAKRIVFASLVCVLILGFSSACGGAGSGSDAFNKLIGHYDNMIKIVKDNKGNAEKANQLLEEYSKKYEAEIEKLSSEIENLAQKEPLKYMELSGKLMEKVGELMTVSMELSGFDKFGDFNLEENTSPSE